MNFIKRHYVFVSILSGAVFGYLVLNPFINIVDVFYHWHDWHLHFHWKNILNAFVDSFSLTHLPNAISYVILSGTIAYFFGKTINTYRKINEQLENFSKIGMNASSIIHDLNNPLTGIVGYAHLLKRKIDSPQQISYCDVIEKEAARISKMVMDIKMIAQGTETVELSKTPTDLEPFLKNIVSKMPLHCEVMIDPRFKGEVLIDRDYFERVFWNLIKNAGEALEIVKNGRIEISMVESDNSVTIRISDNGPGIPKKILKNMFKLGQTFGKKGGSGIGLYNCKKIVEAHGGKIWLTSEVGKGTNFYIKIPK